MIERIPKKIHYCWFGKKTISEETKKYIKTWKKYCPDYEIIKWDETNFDINANKFVKEAYKNKKYAFVSDYARLKIIYENGGIYLDTDVEVLRNMDELLNNTTYFPIQQSDRKIATGLGFGSIKGTRIIKEMMSVYENISFNPNELMKLSCPELNTEILKKYGYRYSNKIENIPEINAAIYPPEYFDPIAPGDTENLLTKNTYSIHHYAASWTPYKNRVKRKIFNLIGQKNVNEIKKWIRR